MSEEENMCLSPGLHLSIPVCFLSERVVDASKGPLGPLLVLFVEE